MTWRVRARLLTLLLPLTGCAAMRPAALPPHEVEQLILEAIRFSSPELATAARPVLVREHTGQLREQTVIPLGPDAMARVAAALRLQVRSENGLRHRPEGELALIDTDFAIWAYVLTHSARSAEVQVMREMSAPRWSGSGARVLLQRDERGVWRATRILSTGITD